MRSINGIRWTNRQKRGRPTIADRPTDREGGGENHDGEKRRKRVRRNLIHLFYFIRTPSFPPSLDVLIFSAISASDVLIDVLNCLTTKIR